MRFSTWDETEAFREFLDRVDPSDENFRKSPEPIPRAEAAKVIEVIRLWKPNSPMQHHYMANSALSHLSVWARTGRLDRKSKTETVKIAVRIVGSGWSPRKHPYHGQSVVREAYAIFGVMGREGWGALPFLIERWQEFGGLQKEVSHAIMAILYTDEKAINDVLKSVAARMKTGTARKPPRSPKGS